MIKILNLSVLILFGVTLQAQESVLKQADSLFRYGNYSKAIAQYQIYDQQNDVFEKMAKSYLALGNYDEALKNYERAHYAYPKDVLLKYDYAKLLSRTKKLNDAAVLFSELVYLDYENPNYHYELGLVLEKQGDSTAVNRFYSAFDLDHTHQKAIRKLAKHYLIKRDHNFSLRYINSGLESYPNNVELISLKALNYYWMTDYKEAAEWFEKLLALGESSQFIHEKLSFCYAEQMLYKKAIVQAHRAVDYDPTSAGNLYILGQLYEKTNDFAAAEQWLSKALQLKDQPLNVEYTALATVLNQQQKYQEALEALQKAIKENPNDDLAQFFLVKTTDAYYADLESKIKMYQVFIEKFPKSAYRDYAQHRLRKLKEDDFMASE